MDSSSAPQWEQELCATVRAHGAKDGGGGPGPSTVKYERRLLQNILTSFPCRRTLGRAMRQKARYLALVEAVILFLCRIMLAKCENL